MEEGKGEAHRLGTAVCQYKGTAPLVRVEHGGTLPSTNSQQHLKQGWETEAGVWSRPPGSAVQVSPGKLCSLSPSPRIARLPCLVSWHISSFIQNILARLTRILHDFCSGEKNPLLLSNLISTPANFPHPLPVLLTLFSTLINTQLPWPRHVHRKCALN